MQLIYFNSLKTHPNLWLKIDTNIYFGYILSNERRVGEI